MTTSLCFECLEIVEQLVKAAQADGDELRARFRQTAAAHDQSPEAFRESWIASVAELSDEEFRSLQALHHPRLAAVRLIQRQHEQASGHRIGWYRGVRAAAAGVVP